MTAKRDVSSAPSTPEAEPSLPFTHPVVLPPRLVLLLASLSLVGWVWHIPIMTSALPHFSTMKPNTALSLGMLAACCWSRRRQRGRANHPGFFWRCGLGLAMMLSCGTIIEYTFNTDLGIDNLFLSVPLGPFDDSAGRMALGTAVCLALTGCSLMLLDRAPRSSIWMLLTVDLIASSALLVFILNVGPLTDIPWLRSLAVPTALSLLMLSIASLALRPDRQPTLRLLESVSRDGSALRRVFVFMVLPLLAATPSVVALRGNIPEALATLFMLGILLYSAQTWSSYRRSRIAQELKPIAGTK